MSEPPAEAASGIKLLEREAHVWLAPWTADHEGVPRDDQRAWLVADELASIDRMPRPEQRRERLRAHVLLRMALSRYEPVEPSDWRFAAGEHGRPEIVAPATTRLRFNLSHTPGLAACVVTCDIDCGIDVERIHRAEQRLQLADRLLSAAEARALSSLPEEARRRRFFEHWTLKESYLKARGTGLGVELDHVRFRFDALGRVRVEFAPELDEHESDWQFWHGAPTRDHALGVALRVGPSGHRKIVCREVEP